MTAYFNENDPFAAAWLRELITEGLIADGIVDERSITEVSACDLRGFDQCHFFAGIGGWPYALRLAGWSDSKPVWTGSCPCQKLSSAARGRNVAADLWPAFYRLIVSERPAVVFGEQVTQTDWFDQVCNDLEAVGYEVGAAVLPACSVRLDHERYRIYFVGHSDSDSKSSRAFHAETPRVQKYRSVSENLAASNGLSNRVGRLRGYGNAIVAPLAQAFIEAYKESVNENNA